MFGTLRRPKELLLILLFAPFIKPVGLDYFPLLNNLFFVWKLAALAFLALVLIPKTFCPTPKKKAPGLICLGVFWAVYIVNAVRVGVEVVSILTAALSSLLLILLVCYQVRCGNSDVLLRAMSHLFSGCIIAHVASVFLVDFGLLRFSDVDAQYTYLFGVDNYSAFFLYPMLAIVLYRQRLQHQKLGPFGWGLLLAVTFAYLCTSSMTAAGAGLIFICLCLIHHHWGRLQKLLDIRWILVATVVLLVLICVFQIQLLLSSLLDSMGKGITLNSRTYIWDAALKLIAEKPLFGHGSLTPEQIEAYVLYGTTHAHNLLLELLLRTGIIGTAAYIFFFCGFLIPAKRPRLFRSDAGLLIIGLIVQIILFFMDFYPTMPIFYCFMGLLYCADKITPAKGVIS